MKPELSLSDDGWAAIVEDVESDWWQLHECTEEAQNV